jgi:ankyrin repeat protein
MREAVDAVRRGDSDAVAAFLAAAPALLTARAENGETLLGVAASAATTDHSDGPSDGRTAHLDVVRTLIAAGVDPSAADARGWTPLHSAGIAGETPLARMLVDAGADGGVGAFGVASATPLAFCLFYGHVDCGRVLVGAVRGRTPDDLRVAAALGDATRLEEWLAAGRPLPSAASSGFDFAGPPQWFPPREGPVDDQRVLDEALAWAARAGAIDSMRRLLGAGADVNSNAYRGTPLLWAVYADRDDAAAWLLDHGADPDLRHDFGGSEHGKGATAMHLAAQYGSLRSLRLLLDRGADATIADERFGGTPLGWAKHSESHDAVAMLEAR